MVDPLEVYVLVGLGIEMLIHPTRVVEREGRGQMESAKAVIAAEAMVEVTKMLPPDSVGAFEMLRDGLDDAVVRIRLVVEEMMACVRELEVGELAEDVLTVLKDRPLEVILEVVLEVLLTPREVPRPSEDDKVPFAVADGAANPVV
ncbi:hypothetical protein G6011_05358 [Alternaria panax]|uniref:Uncharacterized protein n=1 Tax=Alternaria panax TaxID=48097 RepID=A0AAD4FCW2_9PLEO|nr:hypothetical protein G6011_05358 [Alternaria panax]